MIKRISMALAIGFLVATPSFAGPFGVQMGAPISSIPGAKPGKAMGELTLYSVSTLPTPNPEFESYTVLASAKSGICKVSGIGKDHTGDASGARIRGVFDTLSETLTQKYGPSRLFDFVHVGALWNEPGEFAMALTKEERSLLRFWDEDEKSTLPGDISNISLEAKGNGRDVTYITLSYELGNFATCSDMINKASSAGL